MLNQITTWVRQSAAEVTRWKAFYADGKRYFQTLADQPTLEALFRDTVKIVEIEPHNYCNRVCSFCGNSSIDRRTHKIAMSDSVFESILSTLEKVSFSGQIRFARYSEPLALDSIYAMISRAKRRCPNAEIMIISNGDYLYPSTMNRLIEAGLDRLHVSIYLPAKETWTLSRARHFAKKFLDRLEIKESIESYAENKIQGVIEWPGLAITYNSVNYDLEGVFRLGVGQVIPDEYARRDPCMLVLYNVTIDFDGAVLPCCNLRGDHPDHQKYVLGRIGQDGELLDIWGNQTSVGWRKELFKFKTHRDPCASCSQVDLSQEMHWPVRLLVWKNGAGHPDKVKRVD